MENKDKAVSLFRYIKELYAQKYQVVNDVNNQEWHKYITDIPKDDENIIINYMDRTVDDGEETVDTAILMQVSKPEFEKAPPLPLVLKEWVQTGWDKFSNELHKIDKKKIEDDSNENNEFPVEKKDRFEYFEDDSERVYAYKIFAKVRNEWVVRQRRINETRKLFNELHIKYIDLERDSEIIELMVGQGLLKCDIGNFNKSNHPILLKKVSIQFDALKNMISIVETDSSPEIYTMLLQDIDFINHTAIKALKEELFLEFYHPLDRNETPDFLKKLAHRLHAESRYIENSNEYLIGEEKLVIVNNPVFFIRKRTGGVIKAIDEIIEEIEETGKVSGPILNLIGDNVPQMTEIATPLTVGDTLSAISGEDKDILLSKEANKEQLEIAKRIENYNAVLVQGPPGTGKTHTIANLMGHFLAQGKNILVTSHTKKALSVVKEKVAPELQDLCVSVLDENSRDMERSVDGITDYISSHASLELQDDIENLKNKRNNVLKKLNEVRNNIFAIKHKEFEPIVIGGESFSCAEAAKFVYDNSEELSYIPGKVVLNKAFPVTSSDLSLLYDTNRIISIGDSKELELSLPDPKGMMDPKVFEKLIKEEVVIKEENEKLIEGTDLEVNYDDFRVNLKGKELLYEYDKASLIELKNYLLETNIEVENLEPWCIHAILDGKKGGGYRAAWDRLIEKIEDTSKFASENILLFLGKKIDGEFSKTLQTKTLLLEIKESIQKNKEINMLGLLVNDRWMEIYNKIIVDNQFINTPQKLMVLDKEISGNLNRTIETITTLKEMRVHLLKGKKIGGLSLFKPKPWMEIYNIVSINDTRILSVTDCDILIASCELDIKRKEIKQLWNELIEQKGGISFDSLGSDYEDGAIRYIDRIKQYKSIYDNVRINGNYIQSIEDCNLLIAGCEISIKREELSNVWNELISKHGNGSLADFGSEPEEVAISYLSNIKNYIGWNDNIFSEIKNKINIAKFNELSFLGNQGYSSPIDEIKEIIQKVYINLPKYIEISINVYDKLSAIHSDINNLKSKLSSENIEKSITCQKLMTAIDYRDSAMYQVYYEELSKLYEKYHYASERARILSDIKLYAPDWAELIKNRVGIHGEHTPPSNIVEAWKWKQLAGIIDEITAMPFESLQHQSVDLISELRKRTAKLAEKSAWHHLFGRIEKDISQKQALQGWKLTVKKIGKGTGKKAPALKREAQKLMAKCQTAVPAWIMPVNKALESLDPKVNKFDIVIIDEASQSDISALAIIYLAKKIIIVGDDEQVSPSAVGFDNDKMTNLSEMYIKGIVPNSHLYDMKSSLYDIAKTTFPTLMLKEHFRCVPSIIGYSNRLSYDYKIKPLRDDSNVTVKPSTISYRVHDGMRSGRKKVNEKEAEAIVALMLACMEFEEYKNMSFGVISLLGDDQAKYIQSLAMEKISPLDYEKRKILCGNASHFQGDERDIIFISLVDHNEGEAPLRLAGEGIGKATKQRYNVAVSRAKNQLWVVHSLDVSSDLKAGDMRRDLIEYVMCPRSFEEQIEEIKSKADSPFEVSIAKELKLRGYNIVQQWKVGSYKIDMVAVYGDNKIAIECDGELYHSGDEKIREDMERQTILERLGWRFIRIRGSEYYRNPKKTMERVINELGIYEIEPESTSLIEEENSKLKEDVIIRAEQILCQWEKEDEMEEAL